MRLWEKSKQPHAEMKLSKAEKGKTKLKEKENVTDQTATKHYMTASRNEVTDTVKEKRKVTHYKQANQNKK